MSLRVVFIFAQSHTSFELTTCLNQKEGDMGSVVEENPFGFMFQNITQPSFGFTTLLRKTKKEKKNKRCTLAAQDHKGAVSDYKTIPP